MAAAGLQHKVDLGLIQVPLQHCETAIVGENPGKVLKRLRKHVYEQAPVVTKTGSLLGLVYAEDLKRIFATGDALREDEPSIRTITVTNNTTLAGLLQVMSTNRAVLVASSSARSEGGQMTRVEGLLTISDLNKPTVQAVLYVILAEIETALARSIVAAYEESKKWIALLGRQRQAHIFGYWEVAKRDNVDAGAIHSCNLGDLIAIARKTEILRDTLDHNSGDKSYCSDALCRLRNRVMHPVAPMLRNQADVFDVHRTLEYAAELLKRLEELPTSQHPAGKVNALVPQH